MIELDRTEPERECGANPDRDRAHADQRDAERPVHEVGTRAAVQVPSVQQVDHYGQGEARLRLHREREAEETQRDGVALQRRLTGEEQEERGEHEERRRGVHLSEHSALEENRGVEEHRRGDQRAERSTSCE